MKNKIFIVLFALVIMFIGITQVQAGGYVITELYTYSRVIPENEAGLALGLKVNTALPADMNLYLVFSEKSSDKKVGFELERKDASNDNCWYVKSVDFEFFQATNENRLMAGEVYEVSSAKLINKKTNKESEIYLYDKLEKESSTFEVGKKIDYDGINFVEEQDSSFTPVNTVKIGLYDKIFFTFPDSEGYTIDELRAVLDKFGNPNQGQVIDAKRYKGNVWYVDFSQTQIRSPLPAGDYIVAGFSVNYINNTNSKRFMKSIELNGATLSENNDFINLVYFRTFLDKSLKFNVTSNIHEDPVSNLVLAEIGKQEEDKNILKEFKIEPEITAKVNEKVTLKINSEVELASVILNYSDSSTNETMVVSVKDLNTDDSYFNIPLTTKVGNYELISAILSDKDGNEYHYKNQQNLGAILYYEFNSKINVSDTLDVVEDKLSDLDNAKIDSSVISKIKNLKSGSFVTINSDNNPIIKGEIFEAIKGKNIVLIINYGANQWIFNGNDIKTIKSIDTSVNLLGFNSNASIKEIASRGIIVKYADNGELPGKALVRIKANSDLKNNLNSDKVYVYYYNNATNKMDKVALALSATSDGYYEFYINHNSDYVITSEEIDSAYVSDSVASLSENIKNDKDLTEDETKEEFMLFGFNLLQLIIIGVALIIIIVLIIVVVNSRKKLKKANNNVQ